MKTDRFRVKRNNSYVVEGAGIAIVSGGRERKSQWQERRTCDKFVRNHIVLIHDHLDRQIPQSLTVYGHRHDHGNRQ